MAKTATQGGVKNYLGNQKTVSAIPIKWKSAPNHPETELAYITKAEKNLLLKKDLHNSLNGKPNRGPGGIMSLNGWGDSDGQGGTDTSGGNAGAEGGQGDGSGGYNSNDNNANPGDQDTFNPETGNQGTGGTTIGSINEDKNEGSDKPPVTKPKPKPKPKPPSFNIHTDTNTKPPTTTIGGVEYPVLDTNKKEREEAQKIADAIEKQKAEEFYNATPKYPKYTPTVLKFLGNLNRKPNREFFYNNVLRAGKIPGLDYSVDDLEEAYRDYMDNRMAGKTDAYGNPTAGFSYGNNGKIIGNFMGDNDGGITNIYTSPDDTTTDDDDDDTTDDENQFTYRFGNPNANEALDVTLGRYFNQGGRVPRNMGGIMNAVPRQGYFLGKIVKGVKKAVGSVADAAGKVLKSDFGKAAVMALGGYYLGGGTALGGAKMFGNTGFGSAGFLSNLGRMRGSLLGQAGSRVSDPRGFIPYKEGILTKLGLTQGGGSFMPTLKGALAASPLLAFTDLAKAPANEDIGMGERGGSLIDPLTGQEAVPAEMRASLNDALDNADGDPAKIKQITDAYAFLIPDERLGTYLPYRNYGVKDGGRIGRAEGGLMDLGGMEKDYRAEGGFVPIGREEKADDVPARLSVNEFVFTADAVRNAGGGDIDRGAEVMENMMKNLENGGRVSEESQGNTGAQDMFSVSERIGEVI